jgi:hypothetical protein
MPKLCSPVFLLPPYTVGPYTLRIIPAKKEDFHDKRRKLEHDWTAGVVLIDRSLNTRKSLEALMRSLVTAIHYRSGLNDTCDEEAYTHSLATGLTEIALNCPQFWQQFNKLLEAEYCPGAGWHRASRGIAFHEALQPPTLVVYDGKQCRFEWKPLDYFTKMAAYGFFTPKAGVVELPSQLSGSNASIVALHETLHFIHECEGLKDSHPERAFKKAQAYSLPRFIRQNPGWWSWWLLRTRQESVELPLAA